LYASLYTSIHDKRAMLIVELIIELDIPSELVIDCLDDSLCSGTLTEIAESVEVGE